MPQLKPKHYTWFFFLFPLFHSFPSLSFPPHVPSFSFPSWLLDHIWLCPGSVLRNHPEGAWCSLHARQRYNHCIIYKALIFYSDPTSHITSNLSTSTADSTLHLYQNLSAPLHLFWHLRYFSPGLVLLSSSLVFLFSIPSWHQGATGSSQVGDSVGGCMDLAYHVLMAWFTTSGYYLLPTWTLINVHLHLYHPLNPLSVVMSL